MSNLSLRLKPYLQPFERVLAYAELTALSNSNPEITSEAPEPTLDVDEKTATEILRRISYFDEARIDGVSVLTQQCLREISQTDFPLFVQKLPRSRRLRFGAHDIHEYRGKFFPQLVRSLVNQANLPKGSVICDPMSGSGTTALEAADLGMKFIGTDLNPLSIMLTRAKSMLAAGLTPHEVEAAMSIVDEPFSELKSKALAERLDEKTLVYLSLWFPQDVLLAVLNIRDAIADFNYYPRVQALLQVVLSNIVRKVSHQVEDDLRVRKGVSLYSASSVYDEFSTEAKRQIGLLQRINSVYERYEDLSDSESIDIRHGDARHLNKAFPEYTGGVDCIITSPPYATALPYLDTDRLSLMTLGLIEKSQLKSLELQMIGTREISERQRREWWAAYEVDKDLLTEPIRALIQRIAERNHGDGVGFRRRNLPALLGRYFLDMRQNLLSAYDMLKPGALAFYVVGSNSTKLGDEKVLIPTDELLYELAGFLGFEKIDYLNMDLLSSRDMFRKNRGSSESLLTLRRPDRG
jgi:hypothetical protein